MDNQLASEQLEEGEIVDDDDFEAISDNSIIDSTFGKFVSSNENLRALSLSSESGTEVDKKIERKGKLLHRKNRMKHQRKRKRRRLSSDSSEDSNISLCCDIKGKLKEAIHINGIEGTLKNPLKIRLEAMGSLGNTELVTSAPEPLPEVNNDSDKLDDSDLEQLRMEALKTAILNKFQRRKKRKSVREDEIKPFVTLENKENDTPKDQAVDNKVENQAQVIDLEEDEDVLRASLLAGLAKKITKVQPTNERLAETKPLAPNLPVTFAPVLPNSTVRTFKNANYLHTNKTLQNRPKPQVKPLIINVDDDSDSGDDTKTKSHTYLATKVADLQVISNNVEKFLKEQRAKFEIETKQRFQIINKNKTILEKSAVKLLPKSQQIEYQQLLRRLKNAERRKRAKKIALQKLKVQTLQQPPNSNDLATVNVEQCPKHKTVETEIEQGSQVETVTEPVVRSSVDDPSQLDVNSTDKEHSLQEVNSDKKKGGITNELTMLQRILKEIKTQRNGSLQIKSKYQVLTPIIRQITATSNERKKQEQRIKNLLEQLDDAKKKLAEAHEKFSALVRELVYKKEKIESYENRKTTTNTQNHNVIKKHTVKDDKSDKPNEMNEIVTHSVPVTSTPISPEPNPNDVTISTINTNNEDEDMDVCNSDEMDMCQIDIVDPNDIDQIFKRKSVVKLSIPEYVSPLNFSNYQRYKHVDPHGVMCPYEVNGLCKDTDCTFKHYLKNYKRF